MNEVLEKWAKALRSGEYEQGQTALRLRDEEGKDKFCCLGVLCDLYVKEHPDAPGWEKTGTPGKDSGGPLSVLFAARQDEDPAGGFPSTTVYDWAGIGPWFGEQLASANDSGVKFEDIAEKIENEAHPRDTAFQQMERNKPTTAEELGASETVTA